MNLFDAKTMGKRMADFAKAEARFRSISGKVSDYPASVNEFRKGLARGIEGTKAVGMEQSHARLSEIYKLTGQNLDAIELAVHAQHAYGVLRTEMSLRKFLYVPAHLSEYLGNERLFGEVVWKQFPKARREIREAGNCLASDCNTAAVFTLMRVAEHGLRRLARKLPANPITKNGAYVPLEYADWNAVITAIRNKIAASRSKASPAKDKQLNFYSDLADQAEWIKDLYRNEISHTRKNYSAADALAAMQRVRDFMARIATDLRKVK